MKAYKIALISFAVVAMMCVCPFALAADDSDAYDVTPGESGLSVKIDNMSEADINKLFNATEQKDLAEDVLDKFTENNGYNISDIKITKMSLERGLSSKVAADNLYEGKGMKQSFTISFTATAKNDTSKIFLNREPFGDAVKAIGTNTTATGDKFEVTADVTMYGSKTDSGDFVKNEAGSFVLTSKQEKEYSNVECNITAKYVYTKDAQPANLTVEVKATQESETSVDYKFDFNGVEPAKATAATFISVEQSYVYAANLNTECTVNGNTSSKNFYVDMAPLALLFGGDISIVCQYAEVLDYNISADEFSYVGLDDETSLFAEGDVDPSLSTDAAMETFLKSTGTVSTAYSDARSMADDNNGDVVSPSDALNAILIIAIVVVAIVAVIFLVLFILAMIFRRRKK